MEHEDKNSKIKNKIYPFIGMFVCPDFLILENQHFIDACYNKKESSYLLILLKSISVFFIPKLFFIVSYENSVNNKEI